MAEEIEVTIAPDGKVTVHVPGMAGMGCLELTEELVRMLGGDIERQELEPEAYIEVDAGDEQRDQVWH